MKTLAYGLFWDWRMDEWAIGVGFLWMECTRGLVLGLGPLTLLLGAGSWKADWKDIIAI